jgi:hypothetical protein
MKSKLDKWKEGIEKALANRDKKVFSDGYHLGYDNGSKAEKEIIIQIIKDRRNRLDISYPESAIIAKSELNIIIKILEGKRKA